MDNKEWIAMIDDEILDVFSSRSSAEHALLSAKSEYPDQQCVLFESVAFAEKDKSTLVVNIREM